LVRKARRPVLLAALGQVASRECEKLAGLRPVAVEADFGKDDAVLTVEVPDGPELALRGRMDRLDVGPGVLQVTDYKHSADKNALKKPVDQDSQGVSAFQIPVYLAAASKIYGAGQEKLIGRIVPTRLAGEAAQEIEYGPNDPFLAVDQLSRRRLAKNVEPNLFNAIAGLWQAMLTGDFVPRPEAADCSYCRYKGICRAQASPAQGAEDEA
jgi:RecB family exonuclease